MARIDIYETQDFGLRFALAEIEDRYGELVEYKGKSLNKFGRRDSVGATFAEICQLQGAETTVTAVSTNIINSAVSSSASDTQTLQLEGHTIDGSGNLTFVVQEVVLTGTTPVTLTTPLARATRMFVKSSGTFDSPQAVPVGTISIYASTQAGGITGGVPNTASATKLLIQAGDVQTEHGSTSISSTDYWVITELSTSIGDAANSVGFVTIRPQIRDVANGGVWRPLGKAITLVPGQNGVFEQFRPCQIVPKNHDYRVIAKTDANTAEVYVDTRGFLAN